ncbi:MAG: tetratricopeptide repeat protein [Terriglobales bacterium]
MSEGIQFVVQIYLHRANVGAGTATARGKRQAAELVRTGDFKTAAAHLEIAAGRLPEFAPAHRALAEAYDHLGRGEDAKRERRKGK